MKTSVMILIILIICVLCVIGLYLTDRGTVEETIKNFSEQLKNNVTFDYRLLDKDGPPPNG